MNRYQLVQLCSECELQVMNTFTQHALEDLVTYKEIWHQKHNAITASNHELLDLILAPRTHAYRISRLRCLSAFALKSHHTVFMAHFNVDLSKAKQLHAQQKPDISLLRDFRIRQSFPKLSKARCMNLCRTALHMIVTFFAMLGKMLSRQQPKLVSCSQRCRRSSHGSRIAL